MLPEVWPYVLGIDYDNVSQYIADEFMEEDDDLISLFYPVVELLWDVGILG